MYFFLCLIFSIPLSFPWCISFITFFFPVHIFIITLTRRSFCVEYFYYDSPFPLSFFLLFFFIRVKTSSAYPFISGINSRDIPSFIRVLQFPFFLFSLNPSILRVVGDAHSFLLFPFFFLAYVHASSAKKTLHPPKTFSLFLFLPGQCVVCYIINSHPPLAAITQILL